MPKRQTPSTGHEFGSEERKVIPFLSDNVSSARPFIEQKPPTFEVKPQCSMPKRQTPYEFGTEERKVVPFLNESVSSVAGCSTHRPLTKPTTHRFSNQLCSMPKRQTPYEFGAEEQKVIPFLNESVSSVAGCSTHRPPAKPSAYRFSNQLYSMAVPPKRETPSIGNEFGTEEQKVIPFLTNNVSSVSELGTQKPETKDRAMQTMHISTRALIRACPLSPPKPPILKVKSTQCSASTQHVELGARLTGIQLLHLKQSDRCTLDVGTLIRNTLQQAEHIRETLGLVAKGTVFANPVKYAATMLGIHEQTVRNYANGRQSKHFELEEPGFDDEL